MKPQRISQAEADALLASGVTDTPKIPFLVSHAMEHQDGGLTRFDNITGACWAEDFLTVDDCPLWLENDGLEEMQ